MRHCVTSSILLSVTFLTMAVFIIKVLTNVAPGQVAGETINHPPITVSFSFGGEGQFSIFGYSSPQALVNLDAIGSHDDVRANQDGYFVFSNRPSPLFPQESCLTAQDQLGRISTPICLPPFPTNYNISIGPIILPPTASFNNPATGGDYYIGDEVILSGQTIPNTDVDLSMFTKEKNSSKIATLPHGYIAKKIPDLSKQFNNVTMKQFSLIRSVEAFSFPELMTKSDTRGNYSIALPSSSSKTYRLFAQTNFQSQTSPKSLTLELKILPLWMIIIKFLLFLWAMIKSRLLEIVLLAEIVAVIAYLLKYYSQPHQLMIIEHQIVKRENYLPTVGISNDK